MNDQRILEEITQRLVAEFSPERVILFGSRAWGLPDEKSDIDVLVIVDASAESRYERAVRAHRALTGLPASKDVLVETADEFAFRAQAPASLEHKIRQEGRVLYG